MSFPKPSHDSKKDLGEVKYDNLEDDSPAESASGSSITDPMTTHNPKKATKDKLKIIAFFLIANFLYIISDQKCPYSDATTCAKNFLLPNLPRWAAQIFIAALLFTTIICKGIKRSISRFYTIGAVINIIYLCFFFNPILNAQVYGQMFGFFLALCVILCLSTIGFTTLAIRCWKKSKLTFLGLIVVILMLCGTFYLIQVRPACNTWAKGLDNEEIGAGGDTCTIQAPPTCAYEITDGWLDFSRFKTCSSFQAKQPVMEKYFSGGPVIAFPRTERFLYEERMDLQKSILDQTVPLDGLNDPAGDDFEIFIDKTSEANPTLKINVKRNEDLVTERAKINHEGLAKNVLVIYIDALSRANSLRKLKRQ